MPRKKAAAAGSGIGEVNVGQVENLRDNLLPDPTSEAADARKPRMPFRTSYVLTREQEDVLCIFADQRLTQISDQLGRTGDEGTMGGRTSRQKVVEIQHPDSFFGKRKKYSRMYYGHVDFRRKPETIYEVSNLNAPVSQRITMQMIARAVNYFFGQPDDIDWFSTQAVGAEDETVSDKIKKHSRFKVDECGVKNRFVEGIEYAFIRGEAVLKVTHQKHFQIYKRPATILMGGIGKDGKISVDEPLLDAHGDYIVKGDVFVPQMAPAPAQPATAIRGPEPGADDVGQQIPAPELDAQVPAAQEAPGTEQPAAAEQQQQQATGVQILKRDGVTQLPQIPVWKDTIIERQLITFEGPDVQVVYFEDFICPETATDVQKTDFIAHLYDLDIMQIARMFRGTEAEGDQGIENIHAAVERIREMANGSSLPKSAAKQPRSDFKETDTAGATSVPVSQFVECHMTYDADGDGMQEEIMFIMDRANKTPIYYEYLANVTVRGHRPFYPWRPIPVDQRWYGQGAMELFDSEQEFIDLQVNRYNFSKSKAGRIDFWNPAATMEGSRDPNLKLNHGQTYTLRDGKKKEDAYDFAEAPFDGENLDYLLNLFLQMMQLKSGVVNSGDQQMSGLPSSDLATGIREVKDSGDELFSRMLCHLFPGVKGALKAVIDIIYANMNRAEVFTYFNGEADEILSLSPEDVRDLALNVSLELSRTQQRKAIEMGQTAQALISWYYQMPQELQARLANYARKQLKAMGVVQADSIIEPMQPHRTGGPIDKPSSVGQMLAALIKAGIPVSDDDINTLFSMAKLPAITGRSRIAALPPPSSPQAPEPAVAAV